MNAERASISPATTLMTPDEAAAYLRVCAKTLRSIRQRGLIRYVALTPRKIFYRSADCDAYLESCTRTEVYAPTERRKPPKLRGGGNVVSFSARRRERLAERGR